MSKRGVFFGDWVFALNVITYGLHMSLRRGWGTKREGGGEIFKFVFISQWWLWVSYVRLVSFVGRSFEVHNNNRFWF
jgi:hypothetical protein